LSAATAAVNVKLGARCILKNCEIYENHSHGLSCFSRSLKTKSVAILDNCYVHHNGKSGIVAQGMAALVQLVGTTQIIKNVYFVGMGENRCTEHYHISTRMNRSDFNFDADSIQDNRTPENTFTAKRAGEDWRQAERQSIKMFDVQQYRNYAIPMIKHPRRGKPEKRVLWFVKEKWGGDMKLLSAPFKQYCLAKNVIGSKGKTVEEYRQEVAVKTKGWAGEDLLKVIRGCNSPNFERSIGRYGSIDEGCCLSIQLHERTFDLEFESVGVADYICAHILKYRPDVVVVVNVEHVQRPEKSQEKSQDRRSQDQ
jgi:hypothetical protein